MICEMATKVGLAGPYFILFFIGFLWARFQKWQVWQYRSLFALNVLATSGALVHVLKFCLGRQRPYVSHGVEALYFAPFNFNWDFQSFPSGHAQVTFTLVGIFALLYPRANWLIVPLALVTSFTRVLLLAHFPSDVVGGAAIGLLGVAFTSHLWIKKNWYRHLTSR